MRGILTYLIMATAICSLGSCTKDNLEIEPLDECDTLMVSYANDIVPIIDFRCTSCHFSSGIGDFRDYNVLKTKIDAGEFNSRVFVLQDMPPAGPLTGCEKTVVKAWLNLGAPEN